ncbi:MAG: rhomboid family intramembrane serine protease [Candidatus Bathyarchaeota archaeon]|jgi:membrane associated rhomboid family serine protease
MFPLGDENPTRIRPIINWTIILVSTAIFLWQITPGYPHFIDTLYTYGVTPTQILRGQNTHTLITNIFLHGSWPHLIGNMLFLWIFGDNIEDCCGHLRYLTFYITTGITAAILWTFTATQSPYPAVGASGAISGVLGAYFVLFPTAKIRTLMGIGLLWRVIKLPAYTMIGLWFAYQLILATFLRDTGVAYWAHIGGFIAGIAIARIIRPKLRKPEAYNRPGSWRTRKDTISGS